MNSKPTTDITPTNTLKKYQLTQQAGVMVMIDSEGNAFFDKNGIRYYITHTNKDKAITDKLIEILYPSIGGSRLFEQKTRKKK